MTSIKRNLAALLGAISLAAAPALAGDRPAHRHDHEHGAASATLRLDAGRKWATDAPLRQAMANIRQTMAAALPDIHENRLPAREYDRLARVVEHEVGNIVSHCRLPPAADEQLHLVVGELLAGSGRMAADETAGQRRAGAVTVIGALAQYANYFDDAGFSPIAH